MVVEPNEKASIGKVSFETVPAYNVTKPFHPKENHWVGYILECEGQRIYVAGDTDHLSELESISCDVALVPVGGTYTMTAEEAAELMNQMNPKKAIPTHYGLIVGKKEDGIRFQNLVTNTQVEIQI